MDTRKDEKNSYLTMTDIPGEEEFAAQSLEMQEVKLESEKSSNTSKSESDSEDSENGNEIPELKNENEDSQSDDESSSVHEKTSVSHLKQEEIVDVKAHQNEVAANFMNKYALTFMRALKNYTEAAPRDGYTLGFFTWVRHNFNQRKRFADDFKIRFFYSNSNKEAQLFLEAYLTHKETTFNDHSFSVYLLDALQEDFATENWQRFDPNTLRFYQSSLGSEPKYLYYGVIVNRHEIFKNGIFDPNPFSSLSNYLSGFTWFTYGVAMTKRYEYAEFQAKLPWQIKTSTIVWYREISDTYVFKINYRGKKAIDVEESNKALVNNRRGGLSALTHDPINQEVIAIGHVSTKDIVGAYGLYKSKNPDWYPNPNYQTQRQSKCLHSTLFSEAARRKAIFQDDRKRIEQKKNLKH